MTSPRAGALILTATTAMALALGGCASTPDPRSCSEHESMVRIRPGEPATHRVMSQLCLPSGADAQTPVQVLLHGGTYDRSYWDWPYRPGTYSYVEHATRAGFATLNVDRLGHGASDRPDPRALDSSTHGYLAHQLVQALRDGTLGHAFRAVVLNGHSMGGIAAEHAAGYGGVDALVVSGIPADAGTDAASQDREEDGEGGPPDSELPFWPAERDPAFAGRSLPPGYLTTRPDTRAALFLLQGGHDPEIARMEEVRKDTVTSAELAGVGSPGAPTPAIRVPALYVLGRHDALICRRTGDCTTDPAAAATSEIVERSGHSINLGPGAGDFYRRTIQWLAAQGIAG